jgi:hypothetical protein
MEIRSEARGPHWIAWLAGPDGKPQGSIVMVGQTREEAETRMRRWAEGPRNIATMIESPDARGDPQG